jgi:hypothetical protein
MDGATQVANFDNLEPDYRYKDEFNRDRSYHLVYRTQKGKVWAEIYYRER